MTKRRAAPLEGELFARKGAASAQSESEAAALDTRRVEPPAEDRREPAGGDGRRLRATGRTHRFGATVHPDWLRRLKGAAERDGLMIVEVLERALEAYEREPNGR